ncbi:MAG: thioredoxin family protein [Verrucomicrobia bacterium]|nr:thioredoxin family protein [Verrucomicrobiota bacterium]
MKIACALSLLVVLALPLSAVEIGDSYEKVIAEKGAPVARLEAGETLVLNYADQRIKLKSGKVVEVNAKLSGVTIAEPSASAPTVASGVWTTNYQAALAQARETDGKVFLFFTGSDWCGWCKRLDQEILSTPQFKTYAGRKLILVKLDFPRTLPQSDAEKAQNEQLSRKFKIEGYPTVVVLNGKGKEVARLGYQEGGPGPFIEALKKL